MRRVFLCSWAQNATAVHRGFFAAMQQFCKRNHAELIIVPGRYRNPTSQWTQQQAEHEWWAPELEPYLAGNYRSVKTKRGKLEKMEPKRISLGAGLTLFGDVSIQPTASHPLSGFEVFTGEQHAIFGHPKRALQVVPTGTRSPRVMYTTSACTVENYTDSKAGKKGKAHHVIGALVVVVEGRRHWCRHVSATKDGSFTDLDVRYSPFGWEPAPRALTLTLGDLHAGKEDEANLRGSEELCRLVRAEKVVLHDVLDFHARSHHRRSSRARYESRDAKVEDEIKHAVKLLNRIADWGELWSVVVIRSNHDEHLERWVEEFDRRDPINEPYWHFLRTREYQHRKTSTAYPDLFEMEAVRLGVRSKVIFLGRNESLKVGSVEHGFHGDKGPSGSRGSTRAYARLGVKCTKAHDHTPAIMDGAYSVGVTAKLDHGYNLLPSSWACAQCVLHADGKRQLVFIHNGKIGRL